MKILFLLVAFFAMPGYCAKARCNSPHLSDTNAATKVFIAINPTECTSCINTLRLIRDINPKITFQFVFLESYKDDSAKLVGNFFLKKYQADYQWSDSLYHQFIIRGSISSLSAVNANSKKKVAVPLKALNGKFVDWLNRYVCTMDTVTYDDKIISPGVFSIQQSNGNFYLLNTVQNEIAVFDDINRCKKYSITMPDSIIRCAVIKKLGETAYLRNRELLLQLEVPVPDAFIQFSVSGDTVITISEHRFFTIEEKDTFLNSFLALDKFYDGHWLAGINFNEDTIYDGKQGYILNAGSLYYHNGQLLVGMLGPPGKEVTNNFLAEFIEKDDRYRFKRFLDIRLPEVYSDYVSSFQDCYFDGKYFCLSLADRIYNIQNKEIVDLGIFPEKINKQGDPFYSSRSMIDLKVYDNIIYVIYWNGDINSQVYCKYDRSSKTIIEEHPIPGITFKARIDEFDPAYIIVPLDKESFLMRKMGQ